MIMINRPWYDNRSVFSLWGASYEKNAIKDTSCILLDSGAGDLLLIWLFVVALTVQIS